MELYSSLASGLVWHSLLNSLRHLEMLALDTPYSAVIVVVKSNENEDGNSTDNSIGNGNATNAETNNSQNQSGILFPIASETSHTESYLIGLIKTSGKEKNYELIEYINDVNREYAEVLVEQNINGALDTAYVYGAAIGTVKNMLKAVYRSWQK